MCVSSAYRLHKSAVFPECYVGRVISMSYTDLFWVRAHMIASLAFVEYHLCYKDRKR